MFDSALIDAVGKALMRGAAHNIDLSVAGL